MYIEFHDLFGNLVVVNFTAVFVISKNPDAEGSVLTFSGGTVTEVKETPEEIMRSVKTFVMQSQLRGGH
jgi:hypothetical protein